MAGEAEVVVATNLRDGSTSRSRSVRSLSRHGDPRAVSRPTLQEAEGTTRRDSLPGRSGPAGDALRLLRHSLQRAAQWRPRAGRAREQPRAYGVIEIVHLLGEVQAPAPARSLRRTARAGRPLGRCCDVCDRRAGFPTRRKRFRIRPRRAADKGSSAAPAPAEPLPRRRAAVRRRCARLRKETAGEKPHFHDRPRQHPRRSRRPPRRSCDSKIKPSFSSRSTQPGSRDRRRHDDSATISRPPPCLGGKEGHPCEGTQVTRARRRTTALAVLRRGGLAMSRSPRRPRASRLRPRHRHLASGQRHLEHGRLRSFSTALGKHPALIETSAPGLGLSRISIKHGNSKEHGRARRSELFTVDNQDGHESWCHTAGNQLDGRQAVGFLPDPPPGQALL